MELQCTEIKPGFDSLIGSPKDIRPALSWGLKVKKVPEGCFVVSPVRCKVEFDSTQAI